MDLGEADLLKKLKDGDQEAFNFLFRQYYAPLCRFACRYLGRADLSEDIVSDTFYNIWRIRETLNITLSIKSYLFQAVCKNSLNYLRKVKREEMLEDYLHLYSMGHNNKDSIDGTEPSELLFVSELGKKIRNSVEKLPQQQKTAFILKKYEDKKNREIADMMNISVKTVEMHLTRAMFTLRTDLRNYLDDSHD